MRIVVVGPCGSGKTTLVEALRELGYEARECVQEHSHVADMWRRISRPDVLIFLGISLESVQRRKPGHDWTHSMLEEQARRVAHARANSDLLVATDGLTPQEVLLRVLEFLGQLE